MTAQIANGCRSMREALALYCTMLDFERVEGADALDDPSFSVLARDGGLLHLSSHSGDGAFGTAVAITTTDVDALFRSFRARGLRTPGNPDAPVEVHEGPLDQSWGARVLRQRSGRDHAAFCSGMSVAPYRPPTSFVS